jgi:hypothetical protein
VFELLKTCPGKLFRLLSRDQIGIMRHPISGETLLHICVRRKEDAMEMLDFVFSLFVNPLVPNFDGKLAVDLAKSEKNKQIVTKLEQYSMWRPVKQIQIWFGPFFLMRALAFLLAMKRLNCTSKDVRMLIIQKIANLEQCYNL